jgi:hypothetical protein
LGRLGHYERIGSPASGGALRETPVVTIESAAIEFGGDVARGLTPFTPISISQQTQTSGIAVASIGSIAAEYW